MFTSILLTLPFLHFPKKLIPTREKTTISRFKQQQRMRVCALIRDGASINRINRYGARQTSQVSGRFSIPEKMGRALKSRNPGWRFIIEADRSLSKRPFPWKLWRVGERNNKSSSKPKLPSNDPARATTVGIKGPEITIARLFSYRDPSAAQAVGPFEYGRDRPCGISGPKLNASRVTISELLLNRHRSPSNGSSLIWKKKKNRGETLFHFWNRWYSVNLSKNIICSCNSSRENSRDGRRMMNRMDNIFPRVLMEYLSDGFSRVGKQNNVPIYLRTD